jgi:hypothetical protein
MTNRDQVIEWWRSIQRVDQNCAASFCPHAAVNWAVFLNLRETVNNDKVQKKTTGTEND